MGRTRGLVKNIWRKVCQSKMLHSSLLAGKVSPGLCRKGLGGDSESNRPDQTGLCARPPGPGKGTASPEEDPVGPLSRRQGGPPGRKESPKAQQCPHDMQAIGSSGISQSLPQSCEAEEVIQ